MGLDDAAADVEPHAHAFGLGGEEGLEDLFLLLLGDAGALIRHGKQHVVACGAHLQRQGGIVLPAHGVDGVLHQVQQDLLDQDAVGRQAWQVRRQVDGDGHAIALGSNLGQGQRLRQDLVHGDLALLGRVATHEVAYPLNDRGGTLCLPGDLVQCLVHHGRVGRCRAAGLQPLGQAQRVVADGGQRLVQFVGDGGGHLAHRHQPCRLLQLFFLLLLAFTDGAQCRDVGGHHQLGRLAVHPADHLYPHLEPAVDARNVDLFAHPGVRHRPAVEQRQVAGNVVAEQRVIVVIAEKQAGRRGRRRLFVRRWGDDVQGDDGRRGRDHRDGGIKLVEHGLETFVGVDQLGADPVRFGDVGHRSHPACLLALVVDQRRDIEPNIDDPAILAPCPRLQARRGGATRDRQVQVGHVEVMFLGDPVRVGGQLSHHFFGRITEDLAQCPVHVGDATIVVDHAQPRADGILDGAAERGFGGQRLLHQLAAGDVVGHRVIERFGRARVHADGPAQPAPGIAKAYPAFQRADALLGRGEGLDHVQPVLRIDMVPEARVAQVLAEILHEGRIAAHQRAVRADHAEHVLRQLEQPVAFTLGTQSVMGAAPEQDQ